MSKVTAEEVEIDRLLTLGTITYEAVGWGTGTLNIKCRSNTKCEEESLNKALISLSANEGEVNKDNVKEYVVKELGKKLADKEIRILTVADKKYNIAKRKFKDWKDTYKNERKRA